jgi:serine/threonine protein kinase
MPTVLCPACRRRLRVGSALAGLTVPCPGCARKVTLPSSFADETLASPAGRGETLAAGPAGGSPGSALNASRRFAFLHPPQQAGELGRLGGYRVLGVLGQGGMGVVFVALDPGLQRRVAIKVMLPEAAAHPTGRQRFLREARAVAALQHDHVITVYQVGEDNGVPFLVMPFLEGEALERRLDREGCLRVAEAVRIGREIAEALAAAHARGLIHRDIKPANVWLEAPTGRVKVLDFGLVRAAEDEGDRKLTRTFAVLGTPSYLAPEQAEGKTDARSDLFSLGCVLYEMATGQRAFDGPSVMAILACVAAVTPPAPRALNPTIPPALSDLIMALLAKRPHGRPPSAEAVAARLRTLQAEADIPVAELAPPPVPVVRTRPKTLPPVVETIPVAELAEEPPRPRKDSRRTPAPTTRARTVEEDAADGGESRATLLLGGLVLGLALLVLAGIGGVVWYSAARRGSSRSETQPGGTAREPQPDTPATEAPLPDDLAFVIDEWTSFTSGRPADLWANEKFRTVMMKNATQDDFFGLRPDEIERITTAGPVPASEECSIVRTLAPYDEKKIKEKVCGSDARQETHDGKTYYCRTTGKEECVHFHSKLVFVRAANPTVMRKLLAGYPRRKTGPLSDTLRKAALSKYQMVMYHKSVVANAPAGTPESTVVLMSVRGGLADIETVLTFGSEEQARNAKETTEKGIGVLGDKIKNLNVSVRGKEVVTSGTMDVEAFNAGAK